MISKFKRIFKVHEKTDYFPVVIKWALFLNLFISIYFFRTPFDFYYGYLAYLLLFPKFIRSYGIPKIFFIIFSILFTTGVIHVILGNNQVSEFLKVFVGMSAAYLFFYYIVFDVGVSVKLLFKFYLAGSLFCAAFGIFQLVTYLFGLPIGNGIPWLFGFLIGYPGGVFGLRISTFFGEPSYYAMALSAAVFVAIHDIFYQKRAFFFNYLSAAILLVGVYISFSGMMAASVVISFFLLGLNYGGWKYYLLIVPFALFGVFQLINSSDEFEGRLNGTFNLFIDAPQTSFNVFKYHGSSVILYNNFFVAKENFRRNPLFGTGVGSHPVAFEKYSLTKDVQQEGFNLNVKDANSLFNRLLSETGLFGLTIFFVLFIRFMVKRDKEDETKQDWIVSSACLVIMLIYMGRQGHYFLNGFPLFVWLYYRIGKEKRQLKLTNND